MSQGIWRIKNNVLPKGCIARRAEAESTKLRSKVGEEPWPGMPSDPRNEGQLSALGLMGKACRQVSGGLLRNPRKRSGREVLEALKNTWCDGKSECGVPTTHGERAAGMVLGCDGPINHVCWVPVGVEGNSMTFSKWTSYWQKLSHFMYKEERSLKGTLVYFTGEIAEGRYPSGRAKSDQVGTGGGPRIDEGEGYIGFCWVLLTDLQLL